MSRTTTGFRTSREARARCFAGAFGCAVVFLVSAVVSPQMLAARPPVRHGSAVDPPVLSAPGDEAPHPALKRSNEAMPISQVRSGSDPGMWGQWSSGPALAAILRIFRHLERMDALPLASSSRPLARPVVYRIPEGRAPPCPA